MGGPGSFVVGGGGGCVGGGGGGIVGGGGAASQRKQELVQRVKSYQRSGEQAKQLWATYADMYLGGMRDPNRHDESVLEEFCTNHNIPEVSGTWPGAQQGFVVGGSRMAISYS